MNISKRLKVIGDLVPDNSFILDIGCDHALLDIYVVTKNKNVKAIASDINEGPLKQAKANIKKYNLEEKIEIKKGDGLETYKKEVDTLVLSGLGSTTIVDILSKKKEILKDIKRLIISSNNDYYYLRKSIVNLGFKIIKEEIVYDKGKYYPIIVFEQGKEKYNNFELKYGPKLLKQKNQVLKKYLEIQQNKLEKIYNSLGNKYILKKIKIKREIKKLKRK